MVGDVVADVQRLELSVLGQLLEDVLVKVLEVLLGPALLVVGEGFGWRRGQARLCRDGRGLRRGLGRGAAPEVVEEDGGRDRGLVVGAGAAVSVPAGANLEVEGALFCFCWVGGVRVGEREREARGKGSEREREGERHGAKEVRERERGGRKRRR